MVPAANVQPAPPPAGSEPESDVRRGRRNHRNGAAARAALKNKSPWPRRARRGPHPLRSAPSKTPTNAGRVGAAADGKTGNGDGGGGRVFAGGARRAGEGGRRTPTPRRAQARERRGGQEGRAQEGRARK